MNERVLLTGATGYLGGHLARELMESPRGYRVRLLVRDPGRCAEYAEKGVELVRGDLLDPASLNTALDGVDGVVHSAGLVKNWLPDPSEFDRVNVQALDALLGAAKAAGVQRVVYTSSFFTLGPSRGATPHDESARPSRSFNDYDRTKIDAARVVERHRAGGLDVVSCLPTVIYGPGARTQGNLVASILEDLLRGKLPGIMGDGSQTWNYVHVADAARGHRLALETREASGDYLLGGENVTMKGFLDLACELSDRPKLKRKVPFWFLDLMASMIAIPTALFGRPPELTRGMVAAYREHWACDDAKARRELGYEGRPLRDGLTETLDWLRAETGL